LYGKAISTQKLRYSVITKFYSGRDPGNKVYKSMQPQR